ncbi:hypothetical protein L596_028756 [Steinernema carpocapsae]|uniref:Uncharacterized protein n=1 Tax=Steinernema carpocapsae TaxID=34508 RepID=A0A4V5ZXZ5_STECR|nr:hypothetical protein L596_028756 [Steinernema carpocapsae]
MNSVPLAFIEHTVGLVAQRTNLDKIDSLPEPWRRLMQCQQTLQGEKETFGIFLYEKTSTEFYYEIPGLPTLNELFAMDKKYRVCIRSFLVMKYPKEIVNYEEVPRTSLTKISKQVIFDKVLPLVGRQFLCKTDREDKYMKIGCIDDRDIHRKCFKIALQISSFHLLNVFYNGLETERLLQQGLRMWKMHFLELEGSWPACLATEAVRSSCAKATRLEYGMVPKKLSCIVTFMQFVQDHPPSPVGAELCKVAFDRWVKDRGHVLFSISGLCAFTVEQLQSIAQNGHIDVTIAIDWETVTFTASGFCRKLHFSLYKGATCRLVYT